MSFKSLRISFSRLTDTMVVYLAEQCQKDVSSVPNLPILQFLLLRALLPSNFATVSRSSDPIPIPFFPPTRANNLYYSQPSATLPINTWFVTSSTILALSSAWRLWEPKLKSAMVLKYQGSNLHQTIPGPGSVEACTPMSFIWKHC